MPVKKNSDKSISAISPDQFPELRDFLRGYFHEDLEDEYGSPADAATQFWQDADEDQRKAVADQWAKLMAGTKEPSLDGINNLLERMGSAWNFDNMEEIQKISKIFRKNPSL
jgi:hypothetical protein